MKGGIIPILLGIIAIAPALRLAGQAQNSPNSDDAAKREAWRKTMKQTPLPKQGCFKALYPNTSWQEIGCTTAPNIPLVPGNGPGTQSVGDTNDFVAQVTSGLVSTASGSLGASGVTSESGYINNVPPAYANSFSLQLNSNFFTDPPACSSAANPSVCQGWQQFVVTEGDGGDATLFIQYWLVNYNIACPGGWNAYGSGDCYRNSTSATGLPSFPASSIPIAEVTGEAANGTDTAMFLTSEPAEIYSLNQSSVLDLEQYWTQAEFNVFGDAGGGEANFNADSTFIVQTTLNSGSGAPLCIGPQLGEATAETNNLTLAPQSAPVCCSYGGSIKFAESNASGVGAACGDTGLQVDGNFTATPTSIDGTETTITHPIIEGEIRIQYSAKLEDSTPGSTITYQLFNSCGQSLGTASVSPGTTISYLNTEIDGQTCTYGIHGTMSATAPGYLQSFTSSITF